jgi:uncharacterized protein YjbJ (UPF0337 family)
VNWNQLEGKWKQARGSAKQQWGKLTDDDLTMINGSRDKLVGKLQERYGYAQEEARRRADEWLRTTEEEPAYAGASSHSSNPSHNPSGPHNPSGMKR